MADQIKTTVSAEILLPGVEQANAQLVGLLRASKNLGKELKDQVKEFGQALNSYKNGMKNGFGPVETEEKAVERLNTALVDLQKTMKNQTLLSKGMFSNADAGNVNNFTQLIDKLAKAFDGLKRQSKIEQGTFGIDSKNLKEANSALKILDAQLKAHQFLMENSGASKSLQKQVDLINQNKAAIQGLVKSFEDKKKTEDLVAKQAVENARIVRSAERKAAQEAAQEQRRLKQQTISELAAEHKRIGDFKYSYQFGSTRERLIKTGGDATTEGQQAGANRGHAALLTFQRQSSNNWLESYKNITLVNKEMDKFRSTSEYLNSQLNRLELKKAGAHFSAMPEVFEARMKGTKRRSQEEILRDIYGEHSFKGGSFAGYNVKDSSAVKRAIDEILFKQKELVTLRLQGIRDLGREQNILKEIAAATNRVDHQRAKDRGDDPAHRQRQVANMVGRVSLDGGGAGALLQVQAMLSLNYRLLSGVQNIITSSIRSTVEFEAALKNMQAVSGATNTEMLALEGTIRRVSSTSKFSAVELSNSALILAQAGLSAREVEKALPSISVLATATGSSLAQAVDIATSVVGVFDKTVGDLPDIANKISATMNMSKANAESLRLGLQYVGSTAKETGISLEEILATMGSLSNTGIKSGSTMGTGMRQVITEMQKPSAEFINSLTRIGLTFSDVDVKTNGWVTSLRRLKDAGFVASDAIKSFDVRGAASFNAALNNFNDIERILQSFSDKDMATNATDTQMDSLQSQLLKLNNNFINLITNALQPLSNGLKVMVSGVSSVIQALEPLSGVFSVLGTLIGTAALVLIPMWITRLVSTIPILGGVTTAVKTMTTAMMAGSAAGMYAGLSTQLTQLGFVYGTVASKAGVLAAATTVAGSVMRGLFTLIATHPVGALILGVTAAVAAFGSLSSASERLSEKIDKGVSVLNESQSTADRHTESLKRVETASAKLIEKEDLLRAGKLSLKDAALEVSMVIGEFGEKIDLANPSIEEMATKLEAVRNRLLEINSIDLKNIASQATTTASDYRDQAKLLAEKARARAHPGELWGGASSRAIPILNRVVSNSKFNEFAASSGENVSSIRNLQQFKGSIDESPDLAMAHSVLSTLRNAPGALDIASKDEWATMLESFREINEANRNAGKFKVTAEKAVSSDRTKQEVESYLRQNLVDGLPINALKNRAASLDRRSAEQLREDKLNPAVAAVEQEAQIRTLSKKLIETIQLELEKLESKTGMDPAAKAQIKQMLINAESAASGKVADYSKNYGPSLDRAYESRRFTLEQRNKDALAKGDFSPPTLTANVEKALRATLEELKALETGKRTRGLVPGSEQAKLASEQVNREFTEKKIALDRQIAQIKTKGEEAANSERAAAHDKTAQFARLSAETRLDSLSPFSKVEDISKAIELGLEDMKKAGEEEIAKLKDQREKKIRKGASATELDQLTLLEQSQALKNLEAEKSYKEKGLNKQEKAIFQTYAHKDDFNNRTAELAAMKRAIDLGDFNNSKAVQAADMGIAGSRGKYNQSTSNAQVENLQFNRDQLELAALQAKAPQLQPLINKSVENVKVAKEALEVAERDLKLKKEAGASADEIHNMEKARKSVLEDLAGFQQSELNARKELLDTETKIQGLRFVPGKQAEIGAMTASIGDAWENYKRTIQLMDPNATIGDGMVTTFQTSANALSTALGQIASKAKTTKEAFREMGTSIAQTALNVVTNAAVQQMLKMFIGLFATGFTTTSAADAGVGSGDLSVGSSIQTSGTANAAVGGQATPNGFSYSSTPQHFARGGPVRGGVPGRDSVPAWLMPGEFVIKKKVVDAVGADYFHAMNQDAGAMVQSSQRQMESPSDSGKEGNGVVNVYIVTPDQKPNSLGPKDVVAIVTDDISRGGSIKRLVKQVQMGTA